MNLKGSSRVGSHRAQTDSIPRKGDPWRKSRFYFSPVRLAATSSPPRSRLYETRDVSVPEYGEEWNGGGGWREDVFGRDFSHEDVCVCAEICTLDNLHLIPKFQARAGRLGIS